MADLYRHFDKDGQLLYVGISFGAIARLQAHKRDADWFDNIARVEIQKFRTMEAAKKAERKAIQREKPIHNRHRYIEKPKKKVRKEVVKRVAKPKRMPVPHDRPSTYEKYVAESAVELKKIEDRYHSDPVFRAEVDAQMDAMEAARKARSTRRRDGFPGLNEAGLHEDLMPPVKKRNEK